MQDIAREGSIESIANLIELIAAAAVTCPEKTIYVSRIMEMSPDGQAELKGVLQTGLARLSDYEADYDEGDENEMVFGNDDYGDDAKIDEDDDGNLFEANHLKYSGTDNLEEDLIDARNEMANLKSQAFVAAEENEKIQMKLRALVDDLQDRLSTRQEDLESLESDLKKTVLELEETKSRLVEVEELKEQMADDLDVANAKAQQLHKAEATVVAYKKKLESVGVINQQMNDLEGQAASYLQQIMELEAEVKKSAALQKAVNELEEKVAKLEKERSDAEASTKSAAIEIAELKNRLSAAENAKKLYEDELSELRSKQEHNGAADDVVAGVEGLSLENQPSVEHREKLMRAEIENKKLHERLDQLTKEMAVVTARSIQLESTPPPAASPSADDTASTRELKQEVQRLYEALVVKEKENAKISSDKDKLEAYTKRTLAKFQDKYLVALQECKAKLKEKQDKIDALESRSASERTAQKREERLLSSTIYELGLAIMQHRLKTSTSGS
jgi:DNA repair exonuclease SbcCD ATPase subunit